MTFTKKKCILLLHLILILVVGGSPIFCKTANTVGIMTSQLSRSLAGMNIVYVYVYYNTMILYAVPKNNQNIIFSNRVRHLCKQSTSCLSTNLRIQFDSNSLRGRRTWICHLCLSNVRYNINVFTTFQQYSRLIGHINLIFKFDKQE